ncbi:MAG: lactate racemization operon protein LarA, partial [Anaerovoracaceae bacterium]
GGELFFRKMSDCNTLEELEAEIMSTPMDETIPDQWQYQILVRILKKHQVILVCDQMNASAVRKMKLDYSETLDEAMEKARCIMGNGASITVIPDGVSVIGI